MSGNLYENPSKQLDETEDMRTSSQTPTKKSKKKPKEWNEEKKVRESRVPSNGQIDAGPAHRDTRVENKKAEPHLKPHITDLMAGTFGGSKPMLRLFPLGVICILAIMTRFYTLNEPDHVCWDETHFGKMGSFYINRTFFFDVHPPLGKMLIGLSGHLSGYDGAFPFDKPGDKYGNTKYYGMRFFCASLGALIIPLTYLTVEEMTKSTSAALLASSLILFDVGFLTLSQYILLDPILLFCISASVFCLVKFHSYRDTPFSVWWWGWMAALGLSLACSFSVKWVGLFVILLAGVSTAWDLWCLLGDLTLTKLALLYHLAARVICLIVLPGLVYIAFFAIHFKALNKSGNGDGFFSSAFQASLIGNKLHNVAMPYDVAYGSVITLKNHRAGGGLLHSHHHLYPEGVGAMQQQVTTYSHKDVNNDWLVKKFNVNPPPNNAPDSPVEFVKHGDLVRLEHVPTKRNLHSHLQPAPLTSRHHQVTCYGENGTGDANDVWRVEIVGGREGDRVKVVRTKLKLIHQINGCALFSHSKQLPKWGWEQGEVTCNPYTRDKKNYWNVEDHTNSRVPSVSFSLFVPSFLESFLEAHTVMASGNNNLKPKEGEVTSQPWQWPINYRGQRFSGANESEYRVYLLGNPVIWWGNLSVLILFSLVGVVWLFMQQRGCELSPAYRGSVSSVYGSCGWLLLGWALHYLPFYLMGRVLYFHHYFPAMLFSCMFTGIFVDHSLQLLDLQLARWFPHTHPSAVVIILGVIIHSFYLFHPLSYGMIGPSGDNPGSPMAGLKWLASWEF